jgi:hypothetical protein
MSKQDWIIAGVIAATMAMAVALFGTAQPHANVTSAAPDYLRSTYSPLHFRPAAEYATDAECLACHREVLDDRVQPKSPAGIEAKDSLAWYQRLSTYTGDQETFHRRHMTTPLAKQLMTLQCNTCHQGHDPREEAQGSSATGPGSDDDAFTLRKQVNPETVCLKCHGQMNFPAMGLKGPWPDVAQENPKGCYTCHDKTRTRRHNVTYLNAEAIEETGKDNADACYGCHGGRAWYRIAYPYPRHPWPNMPTATPDWAKDRPGYSEPRFAKPSSPVNR